ncbi:FCD domain-containing protein [Pseudonocardia petroleophila]|uniref:FCD domain-containing protein n=1 Tax=Pseudonocardia petroleophila TaxID=37331 RepID=UPI002103FEDC|nr:FCD domain-containing protein [Pseudonocardia petroleophila]
MTGSGPAGRPGREFHRLTTEGAPMLDGAICALGDRSERFLRMAQFSTPMASSRWDADHGTLVEAFRSGDHDLAVRTIAQHLARTAFTALADIAPCEDATATRAALRLLVADG